jgi:hypothetical protein
MSGVNGGLNENFVHGRSPVREADAGKTHKVRRWPQAVAHT